MSKKIDTKVCELCKQDVQDEIKYGKFMTKGNISVHYYCLLLSSNLVQNGDENEGFLGFLPKDIINESKRVKIQICYYCQENHANVACCSSKCRKTFHLSCGIENGVMCHFTGTYQSFCPKHAEWDKSKRPNKDEICLICHEKFEKFNKYFIILSPCCKTGWFHRWCLASFALSAGYFFKCPKCNDTNTFREEIVRKGIFIPDQDAAWELENNAFSELLERPNECAAIECICPNGRNFNESPNNLIMCYTCGSKAIHKKCMNKISSIFNCKDCTEFLKNRTLDIEQISDNKDNVLNDNNDDEEEIIVFDDSDKESISHKTEESDECTLLYLQNKLKRNRLKIEDDDEHEICLNNVDKNEFKNDKSNEDNLIENGQNSNNLNLSTTQLSSSSSLESINKVLKLGKTKKKRARKLSESSNISISSSSSSFDLPLRRRVFQMISSSRESSYVSNNEECEKSEIPESKMNDHDQNNDDDNDVDDSNEKVAKDSKTLNKNEECDEKVQILENQRNSSLGYGSDNLPSSAKSSKTEMSYECDNCEKENRKIIKRRRRKTYLEEHEDDEDEYYDRDYDHKRSKKMSKNKLEMSLNVRAKLRKRTEVKKGPYQLRQRSSSIFYDTSEDEIIESKWKNLNNSWSFLLSSLKTGRTKTKKCSNSTKYKRQKIKTEKFSQSDILPGQTSIDSFFRRKTQ